MSISSFTDQTKKYLRSPKWLLTRPNKTPRTWAGAYSYFFSFGGAFNRAHQRFPSAPTVICSLFQWHNFFCTAANGLARKNTKAGKDRNCRGIKKGSKEILCRGVNCARVFVFLCDPGPVRWPIMFHRLVWKCLYAVLESHSRLRGLKNSLVLYLCTAERKLTVLCRRIIKLKCSLVL